jgi:hypothetical protein
MNILHIKADEYYAIDAVSNSLISKILKSPAHAKAYLDNQPAPTKAMEFGTAFHAAILEPKEFAEQYVVFSGDRRTKEGKAAYEELMDSEKEFCQPTIWKLYRVCSHRYSHILLPGN